MIGGSKKEEDFTSAADVVVKIKVMLPLILVMAARPYLRDLIRNYAIYAAAKVDAPVLLLTGKLVIQVSEDRLLAE